MGSRRCGWESRHRGHQSGFTLVELIIVMAVVVTLATIAIPKFLRARFNTNESAAIATLKTCASALESFRAAQTPPAYPADLTELSDADPQYASESVTDGVTQGYTFDYVQVGDNEYALTAAPEMDGVTGTRVFYVDESGVIRLDDENGEPVQ